MYDYECPDGHVTEHWHKTFQQGSVCGWDGCMQKAQYIPSFYYSSHAAQCFSPVVVHKDSEGNVRFPGHADAPVPPGFQKVELTDVHQIRKFESEVNKRDRERAEKFHEAKATLLNGQLKENRRVMEELVKNFTPRGRRFYDKMREVSEAKQSSAGRPIDPGFYIEAFTQDSSNRDGYRDAKNNWGKHTRNGK
jgi:hypothetical protein